MKFNGRITNLKTKQDPELGMMVVATVEIPFLLYKGAEPQRDYNLVHVGSCTITQDERA